MKGNCRKNKTAYDCLKSGCEYAEAWEGAFFCHKPKDPQLIKGQVTLDFAHIEELKKK